MLSAQGVLQPSSATSVGALGSNRTIQQQQWRQQQSDRVASSSNRTMQQQQSDRVALSSNDTIQQQQWRQQQQNDRVVSSSNRTMQQQQGDQVALRRSNRTMQQQQNSSNPSSGIVQQQQQNSQIDEQDQASQARLESLTQPVFIAKDVRRFDSYVAYKQWNIYEAEIAHVDEFEVEDTDIFFGNIIREYQTKAWHEYHGIVSLTLEEWKSHSSFPSEQWDVCSTRIIEPLLEKGYRFLVKADGDMIISVGKEELIKRVNKAYKTKHHEKEKSKKNELEKRKRQRRRTAD